MNKKNKILIGVVVVLVLVAIDVMKFTSRYKIDINNKADKTVNNLELRYKVNGTIQNISELEPKKFWEYNVNTSELKSEDQILLTYKDSKGNYYEQYLVGYLEKGYRGKVNVVINKIDDNGKLDVKVE
ncbi:hypothetical protein [Clostridium fungisolvens]|uniref:Uncharacterized protein n=1 Tax=Clostridium fungisolvens TaxID=1604897 RepID=A0A6V8SKC3_9CLOT|nr:hypothetical protein [Clostridium fungisolvens]GFP77380.1 hypothetical protein bsdtw1_03507 [Clostridium fungisolvens]